MIVCPRAAAQALGSGRNDVFDKGDSSIFQLDRAPGDRVAHWWIRVGVTDALDDTPHDRFADSLAGSGGAAQAPRASKSMHRSSSAGGNRSARASSPRGLKARETPGVSSARALAQAAMDLEMLRSVMAEFEGCALKRTATQLVFADGVPGSRVMFVGEAPGAEEDRIGRPFVGRAGQLLDRMLNAIGLERQTVYVANVVPWRPPGNRTPTPQETQICLPFIERQIELADPEYPSLSRASGGSHDVECRAWDHARPRLMVPLFAPNRPRDPGAGHAASGFPVAATRA